MSVNWLAIILALYCSISILMAHKAYICFRKADGGVKLETVISVSFVLVFWLPVVIRGMITELIKPSAA